MTRNVALCYIRKSLIKRGQPDPASPALQEEACLAKVRELHLKPEIFSDVEGHSSGHTEDRIGWQRLRTRLNDPDVAALVVYAWSRAVRNTKLLLDLIDYCTSIDVRFISVSQSIDTKSADGRLILTMLAAVDEAEVTRSSERRIETVDFLRRHRGRYYGYPPFGTTFERRGGDLVLSPSTQPQPNGTDHQSLTRCYEIYVLEGLSYERTAAKLCAEGWQVRTKAKHDLRPWNVSDVRRCLEGHWIYAGYVTVGRAYQNMTEILKGAHDPILPDALTSAVAARKEAHKKNAQPKHAPTYHPLSHILRCPAGCKLYGMKLVGAEVYRHIAPCPLKARRRWNTEALESQVRQHIAGLEIPRDITAEAGAEANKLLASGHGGGAEAERLRISASLERAKDLYISGDLTREEYDARRATLMKQIPPDMPELAPELIGLQEAQAAILTAPDTIFGEIVRTLYSAITITPDGLEYAPFEWCADWA